MIINGWEIDDHSYMQAMHDAYEHSNTVCPEQSLTLHALQYCRPKDIKAVILGQDPYHSRDSNGTDKAWGLSFGYNPEWIGKPNSSMLNILDELIDCDYNTPDLSLQGWARQGVLLLNTQLTVEIDKPLSHNGIWNKIVDQILRQVPEHAVGLAWGNPAKKVLERYYMYHLHTSHPCSYSANRGKVPFLGSRCFTKVNQILERIGKQPIDWSA